MYTSEIRKKKKKKKKETGHIRQSVDQESASNASSRIIKNSSFCSTDAESILKRLYNGQIDFDRTGVDYFHLLRLASISSSSSLDRNNRFLL